MKNKLFKSLLFISLFIVVLAGCSSNSDSANEPGEEVLKDELHFASNAQPPTIDPLMSNAVVTRQVAMAIFESLVTFNESYEPVPMLAESIDISEDGKTYTFNLRKGVKFHNGDEMKAEDVVASMERWKEYSSSARATLVDPKFEEVDEYTVKLTVTEPTTLVLGAIANTSHLAAIMPKEVVDAATESGVSEYIGTGPFKFVEWKQDQYIHFTKFDEYAALETPPSGLAGKREALIKDVYYEIVLDPSTQLTGVQTGEYDIAAGVLQDDLAHVEANADLDTISPYSSNYVFLLNRKEGPFNNKEMRQAFSNAVDHDAIAAVSAVNNYEVGPSLMPKENQQWYTEAGEEYYNQKDPEKAKEFLSKAGYNGETITILTTRDYPMMFNNAVIVQEQLEKIGMKVELLVYDWATALSEVRNSPQDWDIFTTAFPAVPSPIEMLYFAEGYFDGAETDTQKELLASIRNAKTTEEAQKYWEELQTYSIEDVKIVKLYDVYAPLVFSNKVKGFTFFDNPVFWNTKVTE